jgi:hypothetical protein
MPGTPAREQYERERGVHGSIHQALPYDFGDPRVSDLFDLLGNFQRRLGDPWFELAFTLLDGIPASEIELRLGQAAGAANGKLSPRQLAQLKLEFFALTRIPYQLMRDGLGMAAQGDGVSRRPELLARAEADLATVSQRVQQLRP